MREFGVQIVRLLLLAGCLCAPLGLFAADSGPVSPPDLKLARAAFSALVRSDGLVYVVNGQNPQGKPVLDFEVYSLGAGSLPLSSRPDLDPPNRSGGETATLLSRDRLLVCKDQNCEVYDPATGNWTKITVSGNWLAPVVPLADGRLLRTGGVDNLGFSDSHSFLIDPETLSSISVGTMRISTAEPGMARLPDDRVIATGGLYYFVSGSPAGPTPVVQAQVYDPKTQTWSQVSSMKYHGGSVDAIVLADGRVMVGKGGGLDNNRNQDAEIYDPAKDQWTLAEGLRWSVGANGTLLPDGSVLVSGTGAQANQTLIWNPVDGSIRRGRPMTIPRSGFEVVRLPDGTLLAMGGVSGDATNGFPRTSSVEMLSFGQPKTTITLNPDFYIATANQSSVSDDGFWGLQATIPSNTNGGMFFGGLLAAQGSDVAFASFTIAESQPVTVHADLFPLPNSTGSLDVTLRLLDANKNPVAPAASGTGNVTWTGQLAPGLYVAELRSGPNAPGAAINGTVSATRLQGGVSAGGSLQWSAGVTGYLAFPVSEKKDATFQVFNEQSYGIGRGAGSVVLTVYDGARNVLKKLAPGGIDLLAQKP